MINFLFRNPLFCSHFLILIHFSTLINFLIYSSLILNPHKLSIIISYIFSCGILNPVHFSHSLFGWCHEFRSGVQRLQRRRAELGDRVADAASHARNRVAAARAQRHHRAGSDAGPGHPEKRAVGVGLIEIHHT